MTPTQKKVCLLGDFAVGKTSLVRRFVEGQYDDKYLSSIGVKISRKTMVHHNTLFTLLIWDLAGGDDFSRMTTSYLHGAAGALIVCDISRPETFKIVEVYAQQVRALNPTAVLVLLGNKVDLLPSQAARPESLQQLSQTLEAPLFFTSAKTGEKVEDAFQHLVQQIEARS